MGTYLTHGPKSYPKAHENPKAFSCIPGPIFLESLNHDSGDGPPPWEDCIKIPLRNLISYFYIRLLQALKTQYNSRSLSQRGLKLKHKFPTQRSSTVCCRFRMLQLVLRSFQKCLLKLSRRPF